MAILKQIEEDFIVKEIYSDFKITKYESKYALFVMMKKGMTTYEALQKIAFKLGADLKDIGFAGNKDKKAITFQMISIPSFFMKKNPEEFDIENLKLKLLGYSDDPVKLGKLKGNLFKITLRNFEKQFSIKSINNFYFANYFDDQRFSKNNIEIGEAIIRNDFKKAIINILKYSFDFAEDMFGYWTDFQIKDADKISKILLKSLLKQPKDLVGAIRKIPINISLMYIHSYQSYLFNEILNKFTEIYFKDSYNIIINNKNYLMSNQRIKFLDQVMIPLVGFSTDLSNFKLYDIGSLTMDTLAEHQISFRDFVIRSYPLLTTTGNQRRAYHVTNVVVNRDKDNVILKFQLPAGSYATIVVKSLLSKIGEDLKINS